MRFLTLNSVQPYVVSDYQSFDLFYEDEESNPANQDYKDWINQEFGLESILSIAQAEQEIIKPAIDKYQQELNQIFK